MHLLEHALIELHPGQAPVKKTLSGHVQLDCDPLRFGIDDADAEVIQADPPGRILKPGL